MAFSLSKLFGASKSQIDDTTNAIIADVENKPFGLSDHNVLFAGLNELGGYFFFQTVIVGQLNVKCKTGAKLTFIGENFKLQLDADMPEFESENSPVKGRYVTKIDFKIEESDVQALEKATLKNIQITVKKHDLIFGKYDADILDEEE